jgi:hypothetical protein
MADKENSPKNTEQEEFDELTSLLDVETQDLSASEQERVKALDTDTRCSSFSPLDGRL